MEQNNPKGNGMAVGALALGISSVPTICCGGLGLPIAAVGVILALLSRRGKTMNTQAKIGFGLSLGSLIITLVSIVALMVIGVTSQEFQTMWHDLKDEDISEYDDTEELMEFFQNYMDELLYDTQETPSDNSGDYSYPDMPYSNNGDDNYLDMPYSNNGGDNYLDMPYYDYGNDNYPGNTYNFPNTSNII